MKERPDTEITILWRDAHAQRYRKRVREHIVVTEHDAFWKRRRARSILNQQDIIRSDVAAVRVAGIDVFIVYTGNQPVKINRPGRNKGGIKHKRLSQFRQYFSGQARRQGRFDL